MFLPCLCISSQLIGLTSRLVNVSRILPLTVAPLSETVSKVGAPHVCSAKLSDLDGVAACASAAIAAPVAPMIPKELTEDAYDERLENIFGPMIPLS